MIEAEYHDELWGGQNRSPLITEPEAPQRQPGVEPAHWEGMNRSAKASTIAPEKDADDAKADATAAAVVGFCLVLMVINYAAG